MEMLAAQAQHREDGNVADNEDSIATDGKLGAEEKKALLQKSLNMAASNGDVERVRRLVGGPAKGFVDVNAPDDEGTVPLIYASCFVRVPLTIEHTKIATNARARDTKMWFQHCLMPELKLTNRTVTNGVHSCGQ